MIELLLLLASVLFPVTQQFIQQPSENTQVPPNSAQETVLVTRIVDGDTFEIASGQKVRLIGIDTPEKDECYFSQASNRLATHIENKEVTLTKDVSETDRYGRLLRYVFVGNTLVNTKLVSEGYAQASAYPPDIAHQDTFEAAEKEARNSERGLWGSECNLPATKQSEKKATSVPLSSPKVQQNTIKKPLTTLAPTLAPQQNNTSFSCNCSKTCKYMSSCSEAYFQLETCGCSIRDGDGDGVPCENICGSSN